MVLRGRLLVFTGTAGIGDFHYAGAVGTALPIVPGKGAIVNQVVGVENDGDDFAF